jgi:hypothetical protein
MNSAPITAKDAGDWLPFIERVGLPWVALVVCLFIMGMGLYLFITRLSPELTKIAAAQGITNERLAAANEKAAQLVAEVRHPTPVHGTPLVVVAAEKGKLP